MLRAAPTPKWASMLMMNAVQMAAGPRNRMKGSTGMKAPTAVESPVIQPSRSGDMAAAPIPSSSCVFSCSARSGWLMTSLAARRAAWEPIPRAW